MGWGLGIFGAAVAYFWVVSKVISYYSYPPVAYRPSIQTGCVEQRTVTVSTTTFRHTKDSERFIDAA